MGLFSKDKITLYQVAEDLADDVFQSISGTSLQAYKGLLMDREESEEIDARQKREILAFEMSAFTRVVQSVITNQKEAIDLLDKFHDNIYIKISDSKEEREDFKLFIIDRYKTYFQIIESKENNMLWQLGKQFNYYFLNTDDKGLDAALIMGSSQIFFKTMLIWKNSLQEIFTKYKVIV